MANQSRTLQTVYLVLSVIGFLLPGVPTIAESVETGNILFWTQPTRTTAELFINRTSSAFALDLVATVITALVWMTIEARRIALAGMWRFYLLIALFGLGGTLPLFLWARERRMASMPAA
jgi:hypothetical protein